MPFLRFRTSGVPRSSMHMYMKTARIAPSYRTANRTRNRHNLHAPATEYIRDKLVAENQ